MNGMFSLTDLLLQERTIDAKINKLIARCTGEENLTGEALWQSLAASGFNLGVDSTKGFFTQLVSKHIYGLRESIKKLDTLLEMPLDDEAYKAIAAVKSGFAKELLDNANVARGNFASAMMDMYGVPKEYVDGTKDISQVPDVDLQRIGLFAMSKAPAYFYAWQATEADGSLQKYKCKCHVCLGKDLPPPNSISEVITKASERHESLDKLLVAFASFLLDQFSISLANLVEGVPVYNHDAEEESAEEALNKVLKGLRGTGG